MIADSLVKEFKDSTLLRSAGGDGGPDWFTPLLPSLTASSLRDMVIQHDEADGLHPGPRLLRNCAPTDGLVLTMPSRLRHKDGKAERTGKLLLKVVDGVKEAVQPERSLVMFPLAVRVRGWRIGINCGVLAGIKFENGVKKSAAGSGNPQNLTIAPISAYEFWAWGQVARGDPQISQIAQSCKPRG